MSSCRFEGLEIVMARDSIDGIETYSILIEIMRKLNLINPIQVGRFKFDQENYLMHIKNEANGVVVQFLMG